MVGPISVAWLAVPTLLAMKLALAYYANWYLRSLLNDHLSYFSELLWTLIVMLPE